MSVVILRGDARELPLPDESVDLLVTSPPYWSQRDYRDGGGSLAGQIGNEDTPQQYVEALTECTREWARVLRPAGSMFVNVADTYYSGKGSPGPNGSDAKQRARRGWTRPSDRSGLGIPRKSLCAIPARYEVACLDELGLTLRRDVIWDKVNPTPESAADRCATRHEYLFHLVKRPVYFADLTDIREGDSGYRRPPGAVRRQPPGQRPKRFADSVNAAGALPGSVWRIASQPLFVPAWLGADHPAAFPVEIPRRCILGWSRPGALVVDPFGGSGTTALAADVLGRAGITCDLSWDYCRIARWRTSDPGERARAMQVPKPPPVPDDQLSLFDGQEAI